MAVIQKWGNSLAVRIPAALASQLQVEAGTAVELRVESGAIIVEPERRPRLKLTELLRNCRPAQLHGKADWGEDVGREVLE